jgi:hypothetical protein
MPESLALREIGYCDEQSRLVASSGLLRFARNYGCGRRLGVFNRIFAALAAKGGRPDQLMIDATHLKAHRTAASLLKKGMFPDVSGAPKAA